MNWFSRKRSRRHGDGELHSSDVTWPVAVSRPGDQAVNVEIMSRKFFIIMAA